jgi:hypothetical protein
MSIRAPHRTWLIQLAIVLLLTLVGCQTTGTSAAKNESAIRKIVPGQSQQKDVRRLLGIPTMMYENVLIAGSTRDVWSYHYYHHEIDWIQLVPILNFYSAQGKTDEDSVYVHFDPFGTVADVRVVRRRDRDTSLLDIPFLR